MWDFAGVRSKIMPVSVSILFLYLCSIPWWTEKLVIWTVIVAFDFATGFGLEYLWPVWLIFQSVADAYNINIWNNLWIVC